MGQTGTNLLKTGLIVGPHRVISLAIERLFQSLRRNLRQQPRHAQRR